MTMWTTAQNPIWALRPAVWTKSDGLEWCGLLVDYCDVFISCLDSHSDGTHSLQSIHWWASDVHFSKSVLMKKQTHLHLGCFLTHLYWLNYSFHSVVIKMISYRWVFGAAGERHATFLSAGVGVCAVEVDVQVPVICSKRPTAFPLKKGKHWACNYIYWVLKLRLNCNNLEY